MVRCPGLQNIFPSERVSEEFIKECERMGAFKREKEIILEITEEWNKKAVKVLIQELKVHHGIEDD